MTKATNWLLLGMLAMGLAGACGADEDKGNDEGTGGTGQSPEQTGDACQVAADCFPNVEAGALLGEPQCLDRVEGGYCTHLCQTDADCCAVPGECETDLRQVCAPFESTGQMMCFLSCEAADLVPAPDAGAGTAVDENEFCQREANPAFICRSTGGGSSNRKVCVPGAQCGDATLAAAYPGCIAAADDAACTTAGGQWVAGACQCPTGQTDCACLADTDCLGGCFAPEPDGGDCTAVTEGLCAPNSVSPGCWCQFDDQGVVTRVCF